MLPIKFSVADKIKSLFICRKKSKIYSKGEELVQNEVNMFTIIELLMKIKATLTVLVKDNDDQVQQIENQYFANACIFLNETENS